MTNHRCVSCGDIIPYGRDICWACEHGYTPDKMNTIKEESEYDIRIFKQSKNEVSAEDRVL